MPRLLHRLAVSLLAGMVCLLAPLLSAAQARDFQSFLQNDIIPAGKAAGISDRTLQRELSGLTPDTKLPGLTGSKTPQINFQAEFRKPAGYFRDSQFNGLVAAGRQQSQKHVVALRKIEARFGVPSRILLAIWARESGYGKAKIPHDAIRVLATRAYMGQRPDFFKAELIAALRILQNGDINRAGMKSSWGGAMGQPQFMPSSFEKYAVDFDGDGRRNIWTSEVDTLASIANYLDKHGWRPGRDWGYEVFVPDTISCALEGPDNRQAISQWVQAGIKRVSARPFPSNELSQPGNILMPAGRYGPAFIATENFYVLKEYNESDTYALFVGHLADRYNSNKGFVQAWKPTRDTSRGAVRTLQKRLEAEGHDVGGSDGLIGYKTRRSIGKDQEANGYHPTCWVG
ncbi:lytic murein transglycosylase [Roseibium limicola]